MAAKPVKVAFIADTADLRSSLSKAEAAMDGAAATAQGAGSKIDAAFDSTASHADDVASKGSQAAGALSGLGDLVGGKFGSAMMVGGTAMQAFADAGDLVNVITESNIVKKIKDIAVSTAHKVATVAATVATTAQAAAQRALNVAMRANPIGIIITLITALVAAIVIAYNKNAAFRDLVDKAWGKIKDWIDAGKTAVVNFASAAVDKVQAVAGKFGDLRDKIGDVIGSYSASGGGVLGKLHSMVETIGGLGGKIAEKTAGMWDGLKDSFRSAINAVIGWWNNLSFHLDIPDKIPGLPDSFTISTPNIPMLAAGGVVTRPTLAVVGEAGPEAVIPLSRLGGLGAGTLIVKVDLGAEEMAQLERGRRVAADLRAYTAAGGRL